MPAPTPSPADPAPSETSSAPAAAATEAAATTSDAPAPADGEAPALTVLAAPSNASPAARAQFSARANEVLARGGSPAAAARAAAAALRQLNAASVQAGAAATITQVVTGQGAGALAAALARGISADRALAQEAARAATLAAMQAAAAVQTSAAARLAGAFAQSGGVSGPGAATLAALLATGLDPERAAALAARAAATQAEMLQTSSVPASPEEARAAEIARGSTTGATTDLAAALARGASPAAAAARAAAAEAERAAALGASTVEIADPQLAALVQNPGDGATVTVTRRGQPLTSRREASVPAQAAQEPSNEDETLTAFSTGRLPASFVAPPPGSVQADRLLAVQLRRGVPLEQILAGSLNNTAGDARQNAGAEVQVDVFANRLGAADLSDDYLGSLMSGRAPDRFLRALGQLLHRATPPAEALQRARGRVADPKP